MPKRTYKPKAKKHVQAHGYRARKATKKGKLVLKRRLLKGRHQLA